mgnify:CR=1 FL=1
MKKVFPILTVLFIFTLIIQYIVNMLINDHFVEYSIKTDDNTYLVKESFRYINDESFYDFTIMDSNELFYTFSLNEDFNKQEEIITDIKFLSSGKLQCIFPLYKRHKSGNMSCIYDGKQVSHSYLRQINNNDVLVLTKKLMDEGYEHTSWSNIDVKSTTVNGKPSVTAYQDNILDNYHFVMWGYKGLMILGKNSATYRIYLPNDQYDNTNSALVGKYYISAVFDGSSTISSFLYYNAKDFGKGVINTEKDVIISDDFYFNGVYKNKLYVTDLGTKKQFEVNPATEKAVVVGDERDGFLTVKNGKLTKVKAEEFLKENVYFVNPVVDERFNSLGAIDIVKENTSYYFITKDGEVYRSNEDRIYRPVLLFKLDGLTEWRVKNGDILAVAGDSVYFYNVSVGLRKIATNNELKYNHKNIVDFWKE